MFNVEGETAETKHPVSTPCEALITASRRRLVIKFLRHSTPVESEAVNLANVQDTLARAPSTPAHHISTPTTTRNTNDTMLGLRTATRASSALPVFRNAAARRFNSSVGAKLEGPADNAFNRERAAVKQHAADTSGK